MICMPGEENGKRKKPSRFAFVNAYREREEQKEREMQEYRLAELKRKQAKRKGPILPPAGVGEHGTLREL